MDSPPKIIKVALDVPLSTRFDYLAGNATVDDIGSRVAVPFGNKLLVGILLDVESRSEIPATRLKSAVSIFRDIPPLSPSLLDLFRFCSDYYHHPIGSVMLNALPAGLKTAKPVEMKRPRFFSLTEAGRIGQVRG